MRVLQGAREGPRPWLGAAAWTWPAAAWSLGACSEHLPWLLLDDWVLVQTAAQA